MRHAVCHYIHPETFQPILSTSMKKQIVTGMKKPGDDESSLDHTLAAIQGRVWNDFDKNTMLWDERVRPFWDESLSGSNTRDESSDGGGKTDSENRVAEPVQEMTAVTPESLIDKENRRAWLVRGSSGERVPEWLELGRCAVYFEDFFPFQVEPGVTKDEIRKRADAAGVDTTESGFNHALGQLWRFVNEMEHGDYVLTVRGQDLYLGIIESQASDVGSRGRQQTYREVEWLNATLPIRRRDVNAEVYSKLKTLLTLSNISSVIDRLDRWVQHEFNAEVLFSKQLEKTERVEALIPQPTTELCKDLLVDKSWLTEQAVLLADKRQLIYYGPPGTGKTYLALQLAEDLVREGGEVELVQFHPSYTYEDFFEGYRPVAATGGQVTFEIRHGPLRRIATEARKAPSKPHFLIIDEINRANLAKVFGELYFLLEYRDRNITLQYSEDEFSLPDNLFFIGTMNTADRSIALVDAAMRRRFSFVEMSPNKAPVAGLLGRWLEANGLSTAPADLLNELNRRINDPDASIGPSYLMQKDIDEKGTLERIWQYGIMPLLEERFNGLDGVDLKQFELASLRAEIARRDQT